MISLHQQDTTQSMIRQYAYKRDELINELQVALQALHLNVLLGAA